MTHAMQKLHRVQKEVIKQLTLSPALKFSEIEVDFVNSEQMSYHLKELSSKGYITKTGDKYELTNLGKDYSNLTDDAVDQLERQPKTGVLLTVTRLNECSGELEELVCKRLRQPYYGKIGRLTGKVRFGETIEETAKRELFEETGLTAHKVELTNINRKIRSTQDGEPVQDVIFYCCIIVEFSGELVTNIGIQENFWLSQQRAKTDKELDFHDDYVFVEQQVVGGFKLTESKAVAEGF